MDAPKPPPPAVDPPGGHASLAPPVDDIHSVDQDSDASSQSAATSVRSNHSSGYDLLAPRHRKTVQTPPGPQGEPASAAAAEGRATETEELSPQGEIFRTKIIRVFHLLDTVGDMGEMMTTAGANVQTSEVTDKVTSAHVVHPDRHVQFRVYSQKVSRVRMHNNITPMAPPISSIVSRKKHI